MSTRGDLDDKFDFAAHEKAAVNEYLKVVPFWADVASATGKIIEQAIKTRNVQIHSVQYRHKDPASFAKKASKPSEVDPLKPKYPHPLKEITDLSATRIITFFPRTISEIDKILMSEFKIIERSDKAKNLLEEEKFGYQSVHYLVKLNRARAGLPEYKRFANAVTEIQVRTILQHAWAEIEHDIQYKSTEAIPREIRRRFMALAGMLELADREFQAIQDSDAELGSAAKASVEHGNYSEVEITPMSLKLYLDRHLGPDGRMSEFSYDWTVRLLKRLGFRALDQIHACISEYSDEDVSRILSGTRRGQLSRFEDLLLASLGEKFIERHTFAGESWFGTFPRTQLGLLKEAGVQPSGYDPQATNLDSGRTSKDG